MRNQTVNNSHRKDIWFRAESRTYILFLCLILGCIAFLTLAEGTNAHIIFVKICVYFSVFFGTIIIVSQFKSVIIPASYIDPKDKAVFVTGCASGFGKELVKKLDSLGFKVFAAVRSIEGDDRVQDLLSCCSKRVTMVKMDVTNNNEVLAAASFVKKKLGSSCLWAVVCNAGLYSCQGFDWGSEGISEYERIMNANTFGSVRVVKAFVPLLKETQDSRIVINSSISSEYHCDKSSTSNLYQLCYFFMSGTVSCPILAAYSMSKHALKAFSNSLRLELKPFGVFVSQIQPVYYSTPLVEKEKTRKQLESFWSETPEEVRKSYTEEHKEFINKFMDASLDMCREDVSEVVDALTESIMSSREPDHYVTVASYIEKTAFALGSWFFPSDTFDRFTFGPEAIVSMKILGIVHRITGKIYSMVKSRMF